MVLLQMTYKITPKTFITNNIFSTRYAGRDVEPWTTVEQQTAVDYTETSCCQSKSFHAALCPH